MLTAPFFRARATATKAATAAAVLLASAAALSGCAGQPAPHAAAAQISVGMPSASAALDVTTLNGERPPGRLARLVDTTIMLDTVDVHGQRIVVEKGVRKAGTRVGIHVHQYGGHTRVVSGEITRFFEGPAPQKKPAGTRYYKPPPVMMGAAHPPREDAVLIDTFLLPPGKPTITIREPGFPPR